MSKRIIKIVYTCGDNYNPLTGIVTSEISVECLKNDIGGVYRILNVNIPTPEQYRRGLELFAEDKPVPIECEVYVEMEEIEKPEKFR